MHVQLLTPVKKGGGGGLVERDRSGTSGLLARAKAAVAAGGDGAGGGVKEYADMFKVDAEGNVVDGDVGALVVRQV